MEENVQVVFKYVENRENCINSVILRLASALLDNKHDNSGCSSFRKKLETLSIVMKIKCSSKQTEIIGNNQNCPFVETVLNMCLETLCSMQDGKDLCIPVICDVLCYSFEMLLQSEDNERLSCVLCKCKYDLTNLMAVSSLMCEDLHSSSIEIAKLGINLRIWESIVVVLITCKSGSGRESKKAPVQDLVTFFDDDFFKLLLKLISFEHDVLTSQTLLCLIPKLVTLTESNFIIENLWKYITDIFYSKSGSHKVTCYMFLIMCTLSDFFIPCQFDVHVPFSFPVGQNNDFWLILQYGLVSFDALMRKQALYLLKRSVEYESFVVKVTQSSLFWWNQQKAQSFQKVWDELFLLFEVLEEKQMHLIEPVLPILMSLVKACKECIIHESWIVCVIHRALRHECNPVLKWGIFSLTDLDFDFIVTADVDYTFIFSSLLNALNSSALYVLRRNSLAVPDIVERLRSFFISITKKEFNICRLLFESVLNSLVCVSWGPVALFYVVFALAGVPKCPIWSKSDLQILKSFLIDALGTQVVHIRGAIQSFLIDTLLNLTNTNHLQIGAIADIMGSFRRKECLKRGTQTWHKITAWLKSFIKEEDAFKFAHKSFSSIIGDNMEYEKQAVARMVILLSDADLICLDLYNTCHIYNLSSLLLSVIDYFENCEERMYVCRSKQDSCLEMLVNLLEESQPITENDSTGKFVLSLIHRIIPGTLYTIKKNLFAAYNLEDFDTVNLYLHALNILLQEPMLHSDLVKYSEIMQDASILIITSESESITPMSKYFSIKILMWISSLICHCKGKNNTLQKAQISVLFKKQMEISEKIFQQDLNRVLMKAKQDKILTRDMQTLWGRLVSEYMQGIWSLMHFYIKMQQDFSFLNMNVANHILKESGEALELGGRGMLIPVMSVMKHIVHKLLKDDTQDIKRFMFMCWRSIFELRKSDLFWVAMKKFINMTFQKCLMNITEMDETLSMYAQKIFDEGEMITGLANLLMQQLQDMSQDHALSYFNNFPEILVNALVFGPVHRRDRKMDDETCAFIMSLGDVCCINDVSPSFSDVEVRAKGINLLLSCQQYKTDDGIKILKKVAQLLMSKDLHISQQKTRYYADSYHHRYRNRIMQALLLLEPLLPKEECEQLSTFVQQSLLKENHQPSIRYMQEWLLIRVMFKHITIRSQIWPLLQAASETRPGCVCSFISIVFHISQLLPVDDDLEKCIDKGMSEILPFTMVQHFNVRLYAQVSFLKLWEYADKKALHTITKKYHLVYSCIMTNLQAPCNLQNVKKLEDFYFTRFHPLEHYSLQTILCDLPKLTNVTHEEWISVDVLLSHGAKTSSIVPLLNQDTHLQDCHHLSSIVKPEMIVEDDTSEKAINVQKKIIPWKAMVPDPEMLLSLSESILRRKQTILGDGLIVVASLIDRTPNLGGLSRTCEAFGVSQYVLGSIKYLEDKQFQTLSVSAERWISVTEVKPQELPQYLESMKRNGYTIVGAEQTANSVLLHEVKFPKRTILLLGNEKEGVPVNLLPLLDVCVEVPQQGVIRSLNVHVTGAIFIWEYARQHNVQPTL